MAVSYSPRTVTDGLVFSLDAANSRGISPLGNNLFNGAAELTQNLLPENYSIQSVNGVHIGNLDYYTAFAINFPEGNFGGNAASRHGITPGLNVRSGTKIFNASRALHFWAWNPDTLSWLSSSFFNGSRLSGHCYDSWTGNSSWPQEVAQFVTDYNNIKSQFPNATYIMMGSHRDSGHTTDKLNVLKEVGAPSNVSSLLDGAPEWILVGKPGLGENNAYGWVYENHTIDPTHVAHLNFGLPIYGGPTNHFSFDGVDDYINFSTNIQSGYTSASYEFLVETGNITTSDRRQIYIQESSTWIALHAVSGVVFFGIDLNNGSGWFDNNGGWNTGARTTSTIAANTKYHLVYTWNGSSVKVYLNGVLESTASTLQASNGRQNVTQLGTGTTPRRIGSRNNQFYWNSKIFKSSFYNRELTLSEVQQNYNAIKGRYGL